jgi:hypothetical protein
MKIDLNTCEAGDILISKHGWKLTYVKKLNSEIDYYHHEVKYEDGSRGTRVNSGHVMKNEGKRLDSDHDIVEIIKKVK